MNRRMNSAHNSAPNSEPSPVAAWMRRAANVGAVLGLGLSGALGAFAAPQTNSPTIGTPYSWPGFHAGGTTDPTAVTAGAPVPYYQLQGTPTGQVVNGANSYDTQIPSLILGNYNPAQPPAGVTVTGTGATVNYFPNHFADGPLFSPHYRQLTGPLGFLAPPVGSGTANVQSSPTAVNDTEYPDIGKMKYYGEQTLNTSGATSGAPDTTQRGGVGATGVQRVRQVVYYGRTEAVTALSDGNGGVTVGGVAVPSTANIPVGSVVNVGAIYAMDGFTGAVIWRYQVPSFSATSVVSATNQFRANLTGAAQFNTTTSPSNFQIGPTANATTASPEGSATLNGTAGTFSVTNAPPPGLPPTTPPNTLPNNLNFSLYATNATTTSTVVTTGGTATTVSATNYTGTFRIFQGTSATGTEADDGNILEHGNFNITVSAAGAVTGQFTADVGNLQPSYATGPVDFSLLTPAQVVRGTFVNGALNISLAAPLGGTLQDASPFTSVSVAKINVISPNSGGIANPTLVVIAADNNGFVYCLDALGQGDGSSNTNVEVIGSNPQQIAYTLQDGAVLNTPATAQEAHAHLGRTVPYWIYRPDPAKPRLPDGSGPDPAPSVTHDLPVPQAFNSASPTIYVDPTAAANSHNATVYIGNSNGVMYALDATGGVTPAAAAFDTPRTGLPGVPDLTYTCNPKWWYAVSGTNANTGADTTAIESAPAVYAPVPTAAGSAGGVGSGGTASTPTVYFGTSDSTGNNVGRLYAVDGVNGPTGPNGAAILPGTLTYNVNQQGKWTFPSSFATTAVPAPAFRNPLGDVSGSPVVFLADGVNPVIYFAADTGKEFLNGAEVPASVDNGRLWGVNLDGSYAFSYPSAGSPNAAPTAATLGDFAPANNTPPMEGFLHATPAIGFVQFPTTINYLDTAGAAQPYSVTPQPAAMLYIGTTGTNGGYFYGVDIDPAAATTTTTTTAGSDVIRVVAPNGASFVSSPVLVTNPSTAGGNGGAVFICTSQGQLLQYQATPTSTASSSANYPSPRLDYTFPVGGPISAPAVAAANVSDVVSAPGLIRTESVTDWVYVGDSNSGQCWGFTPRGFGTDTTGQYLNGFLPVTPPNLDLPPVIPQFPLRAFLFDDPQKMLAAATAASPASLSMDNAFGYGIYATPPATPTATNHSPLPAFEWGQSVSVRIANVVPPGAPDPALNNFILINADDGTGSGNTTHYYLGNGGPVTFQVADVSSAAGTAANNNLGVTLSIPNIILSGTPVRPDLQNGFFRRTDPGSRQVNFGPSSELDGSGNPRATQTQLLDPTTKGWVAAGTYSIGANTTTDAQGRLHPNTPGSRRQIISATQTYTLFQSSDNGQTAAGFTPVVQKNAAGAVVTNNANQNKLTLNANPAFSYTQGTGSYPGANGGTPAGSGTIVLDQPTFGILNPLAVRGAGINLTAPNIGTEAQQTWVDTAGLEGVGPFRALPSTTLTTGALQTDMAALANGNNVLTNPPASGVLGDNANPTQGTTALKTFATNYAPYYRYVITTTGQVVHGTTGDNSDPAPIALPATTTTDLQGKSASYGYGPYLLNVADRSALGLTGGGLNVTVQNRAMTWNDNSVNLATSGGPAARINPLPWDDLPLTQQNSSRDYPDIPGSAVTFNLPGTLPGAVANTGGTGTTSRLIVPQSTQVSVSVPKYQPANLQLWARSGNSNAAPTPIAPSQTAISPGNYNFPMGYVSRQRITGTAGTTNFGNRNGNPNEGAAFRVVYVYTGVPVDMSTSIQNTVTDIGAVPHGFGIQMDKYVSPITGAAIGPFTPYNLYNGFAGHFQPLTIRNNGNTNLLNPHLDQKYQYTTSANPLSLSLLSDALNTGIYSPLSTIPAFDFNNVSGNNTNGVNGFLVRSSLDTDLVGLGIGVNPYLSATDRTNYPLGTSTITFHKPRVGDSQGTTMTVPDVPHDNNAPYFLPSAAGQLIVNNSGTTPVLVDPNAATLTPAKALPYVSVAVPLGTPVGNYSTPLQLFEGFDNTYSPLTGPTYTGANNTLDTLSVIQDPNTGIAHGVQTTSKPGTQLLVHVNEDRATDGFTPGALPQFDAAAQTNLASPLVNNTHTLGTADFAPAAFRDPTSGNLSLYWTSARGYNPTGYPPSSPYSVFGTSVTFNPTNGTGTYLNSAGVGHFTPAFGNQWWAPLTQLTIGAVTSVDLGVAVDQIINNGGVPSGGNAAYIFTGTIIGSGTTTQYGINCGQIINTGRANNFGTRVLVANSSQPKSGIHGLTFTGSFQDATNTANTISNNLWAFWTGGTRGRTALYYGSSTAPNGGGTPGTFTTPATLPIPAGLVSVADATASLVQAPEVTANGTTPVPAIEVTYSGVSATGNSDIYVSRYRPYTYTATGATASTVLLGLMRMPLVTELLQADPLSRWYQARDVGWARTGLSPTVGPLSVTLTLNAVTGNVLSTLETDTYTVNTNGTISEFQTLNGTTTNVTPAANSTTGAPKLVFDRASGLLVLTNVTLPTLSGTTVNPSNGQNIFVDLASGRVRFSLTPPAVTNTGGTSITTSVTAAFYPTARRITTSPAADTAPVSFLDTAFKANSSGFTGSTANAATGTTTATGDANVEADRYWVLWHKDAVGKTNPSLWYKTQRLTFALAGNFTDASGNVLSQPITIPLNVNGQPNVTVTVNGNTAYTPGGGTNNVADVDAARGRIYFPIIVNGAPTEGQPVSVTIPGAANPYNGFIHWLDEPRYNDTVNQNAPGTLEAAADDGALVPISNIANESGVTAFLDPAAYANATGNASIGATQIPHNVWVFWTSTRSGTGDIFYETINPRFAPTAP